MKRRRSQGTLDSFVTRVPGLLDVSKEVVEQSCDARTSVNIADESSSDNFSTATTASYADNTSSIIRPNDVGSHIDSISEISHFVKCELQNRFKKRRKHLLNLGCLEKDCLRTKHFRLALFRVQRES